MSSSLRVWSFPGIYPYPEGKDYTTGIFIHKQNLALKELGADVKAVILSEGYPMWPFYLLFSDWKGNHKRTRPFHRSFEGIEIFHPRVSSPKPSRIFNTPGVERQIQTLVKFLKSKNVQKGKDVIMAQWLIPEGYVAVRAAKELGIACAVEMQGDDVQVFPHNSPVHMQHAQWVLNNADLMLGCSDFMGKEANTLISPPVPVHTIYTGINLNRFKPVKESERQIIRTRLGLKENDIVILNVGSAIARKGWLEMFAALGSLKHLNLSVKVLAAVGVYRELDLLQEARKQGIEDSLIDLGQIGHDELPALYQACDIFCLASYWEGLANALCEAMASGCAIITTSVSGHPEVIQSGYNGELVAAKDVDGLTLSFQKMLLDSSLRKSYGEKARLTAEQKIKSHEDNADKLLRLLKSVAG